MNTSQTFAPRFAVNWSTTASRHFSVSAWQYWCADVFEHGRHCLRSVRSEGCQSDDPVLRGMSKLLVMPEEERRFFDSFLQFSSFCSQSVFSRFSLHFL